MEYNIIIDDFIGDWGFTKQYVRNCLKSLKGKSVAVYINSYGGDLGHALDIRQQFIDHGDVTVYLHGFVASAATVIAMGAKKIVMGRECFFLVHKCMNFIDAWGAYNADQLEALIRDLEVNKKENDKIDVVLARMYAARCGKAVSDILPILKAGEWMDAEEALNHGFVDELCDAAFHADINKEAKDRINRKINAFGLPALPVKEDKKESGLMAAVKRCLDSLLNKGASSLPPVGPTNSKSMDITNFKTLAAVLESPDTGDQKGGQKNELVLDEQQAKAINDKLEADSTKIAELEAQVKSLMKQTPEDSADIVDTGDTGEAAITGESLFNSIKNCI